MRKPSRGKKKSLKHHYNTDASAIRKKHKTTLPKPRKTLITRLWGWRAKLSYVLNAFFVLFGFVSSITGNWGPPWQVAPSFAPGGPSTSSPMGVPFAVSNKSGFFSLKNLQIECRIIHATTNNGMEIKNVIVSIDTVSNMIEPSSTAPYTCPFNKAIGIGNATITSATIQFASEYDSWLWPNRTKSLSPVFTLNTETNPRRWEEGQPLQ